MSGFTATLGANYLGWGTQFRVWAPDAGEVGLVLGDAAPQPMKRTGDGFFTATLQSAGPGDLYRYLLDGKGPFPDPASRFQPQGVHGPSQIVDPAAFQWSDNEWHGIAAEDLVIYELHVGTFTVAGTFAAAAGKLRWLKELGITAVELMPVAGFAGDRNWGYDGVSLFAPARCYGRPGDLRRFVDEAHRAGLAVLLDVVYNHFGPDGAYQGTYSPYYFSRVHRSPWGDGINLDGAGSAPVRDYFIENALRWIHEYHMDGLRLDATHAIVDDSPRHILASVSSAVHASMAGSDRRVHVIAEDVRNLSSMLKPESEGGWGLDGVWADDFHHQMRRALAGDSDGYFQDYDGRASSIAETARRGWYYHGQLAPYFGQPRGDDPAGVSYSRFVFCIQNHDQIGNRAFGDRLHHQIGAAAYRAASVLLLALPETPLLFMGQEWAASSPFCYFTDHHAELGQLVTEGRRREFQRFAAFSDPVVRETIPDPQKPATFQASRLDWEETAREPHASVLRLYRHLLRLRRDELRSQGNSGELEIGTSGDDIILLRRGSLLVVVRLRGHGLTALPPGRWTAVLTTEEPAYAVDPQPIQISRAAVEFRRAGAVILRQEGGE